MSKSLEDVLNNMIVEKPYPSQIQKIFDNGIIQEISERNGFYIMLFSFQYKGKCLMSYMSTSRNIYLMNDEYMNEIAYVGALIVDGKYKIHRGVLESFLRDSNGNYEMNTTQLLTKDDGLKLSHLFQDRCFDSMILPIAVTDISTAWRDSITNYHYGYHHGHNIKPEYDDYGNYYGVVKDIYTFISRCNFTSVESIERNVKFVIDKQTILTKLNCASIIGKSVEKAGNKIGKSIKDGCDNIAKSNIMIGVSTQKAGTRVANGVNGCTYAYGD